MSALRTWAVARYLAAALALNQAFLIPIVLFGGVLAVLFGGDPGPPPAPWAASAFIAYFVAAWLAVVVANAEDPAERTATIAAAGGCGRVVAGTLLVALAGDAVLVAMAVLWPVLVTHYAYPPAVVLTGVVAHVATTTAGTAVGLLCARPVVRRTGWSFVIGAVVLVLTAVQRWLPPVGTTVRDLAEPLARAPVADAALGLVLAVAAAGVTLLVQRRA
jgi:hypothetical protein